MKNNHSVGVSQQGVEVAVQLAKHDFDVTLHLIGAPQLGAEAKRSVFVGQASSKGFNILVTFSNDVF